MDIYNMRLHEWLQIDNAMFVIRVAGGWIYYQDNSTEQFIGDKRIGDVVSASMVFVPHNNEFNTPYKPKRKRSR